jgi:hypothetical protein
MFQAIKAVALVKAARELQQEAEKSFPGPVRDALLRESDKLVKQAELIDPDHWLAIW